MHLPKKLLIIATLLAVIVASLLVIFPVAAADCAIPDKADPTICLDDFFASNNILYYDPNAEECTAQPGITTDGPLLGNSSAEKIFVYLVGKGLSGEQAAGILGNFQRESGFDPAIIQGDPPTIAGPNYIPIGGVGFGIAQWTDAGRQDGLKALRDSSNRKIIDLSLQLDYLWEELNTTRAHSLETLKAETTPERAAYVFHRDFEVSDDTETAVIKGRGGDARILYEQYKKLAKTTTKSDVNSPASANCSPTSKDSGGSVTGFMSDDFEIYNQCQYGSYGGPWGTDTTPSGETMCQAACFPTALAMISKNLAGRDVTPKDTTTYWSKHNLWSIHGSNINTPLFAAHDFGLRIETITDKGNLAAYKKVFDNGGLIMAISTGPSPFMEGRHGIVLRGITNEGNFMIADPGQGESTNTPPANQPSTEKILTALRSDYYGISYAFYKQ